MKKSTFALAMMMALSANVYAADSAEHKLTILGKVTTDGCMVDGGDGSVTGLDLVMTLPTVQIDTVVDNPSVGLAALNGDNQTLPLVCSDGIAKVSVSFAPQNANGKYLNNTAAVDAASNIGFVLAAAVNKDVTVGDWMDFTSGDVTLPDTDVVDNKVTINFSANYAKTDVDVTAGNVEAVVPFTIAYL